ncbi:hypothetical protein GGR50DRAFT_389451 [Xylaria sp. CBS 124048]|nr:hypothetical protein GGR50DRAFT_389451 [Xylaria sp. CBS 124048]
MSVFVFGFFLLSSSQKRLTTQLPFRTLPGFPSLVRTRKRKRQNHKPPLPHTHIFVPTSPTTEQLNTTNLLPTLPNLFHLWSLCTHFNPSTPPFRLLILLSLSLSLSLFLFFFLTHTYIYTGSLLSTSTYLISPPSSILPCLLSLVPRASSTPARLVCVCVMKTYPSIHLI